MYRVLAFIALLSACACAPAVTLQQLSVDQMTQSATAIVRARVTGASAAFTGSTIYTHYKLQVTESWKGFAAAEVMVPGGSVKGSKQSFPGVPELNVGSEYVLFLWTSSTGITHLLGLQQGVFDVSGQNEANVVATRGRIGEMMLDRNGKRVADEPVQMRMSDLRAHVSRATASAGPVQ